MVTDVLNDRSFTHGELNAKYGHKCRFFESEFEAKNYSEIYKKRYPHKLCVIYPMRDAIMEVDNETTKIRNDGLIYYKIVGYVKIGFLVSTPE